MSKQTIYQLKDWFKTGKYPTQQQFHDWLDSFRHKDERISESEIDGVDEKMQSILDSYIEATKITEGLYSEIVAIKNTGRLQPGKLYVMRYFQSIYKTTNGYILGSNNDKASDGKTYPSEYYTILLHAVSAAEFDSEVLVITNNGNKLLQAKYDITHNAEMGEKHMGTITELRDERGNVLPYDFLNIRFWNSSLNGYYYTFSTEKTEGSEKRITRNENVTNVVVAHGVAFDNNIFLGEKYKNVKIDVAFSGNIIRDTYENYHMTESFKINSSYPGIWGSDGSIQLDKNSITLDTGYGKSSININKDITLNAREGGDINLNVIGGGGRTRYNGYELMTLAGNSASSPVTGNIVMSDGGKVGLAVSDNFISFTARNTNIKGANSVSLSASDGVTISTGGASIIMNNGVIDLAGTKTNYNKNEIATVDQINTLTNNKLDKTAMNFSTSETVAGTWNGLTLFKRNVYLGYLNMAQRWTNMGIGTVTVRKIEGYAYKPSTNQYFPLPYVHPERYIIIDHTGVSVHFLINENLLDYWSECYAYATVYYTK